MNAKATVLIAEDDDDDLFFSKRVLKKAGVGPVFHVPDGRAAMDYLAGRGAYAERARHPLPDVLLLDLKMPAFTGHEVLEWLRAQPALAKLKVFVLTSSDEPRDRGRAERAGADGYLVKPLVREHLAEIFPNGGGPARDGREGHGAVGAGHHA